VLDGWGQLRSEKKEFGNDACAPCVVSVYTV